MVREPVGHQEGAAADVGMNNTFIYVVDDDENTARMVSLCLQRAGHRAECFQDPVRALASLPLAEPKPALLITDFHMLEMTGIELIQRCRVLVPTLKTILISGGWTGEGMRNVHTRPDGVLRKPFSLEELLAVVGAMLPGAGTIGDPLTSRPRV